MRQKKCTFIGKPIYRTWSEDKALFWLLWRTGAPGAWQEPDIREFKACKCKYMIFFDHTLDQKARELAIYLLDRFTFFKGAKVSKYARDGEKVLVLLGRDESYRDALAEFVKQWEMVLWGVKPAHYVSDHEKQANARYGDYITKLAHAFNAKPS